MSGVFSPDHRDLLIGTENGRIDLFSIDEPSCAKANAFKLLSAPKPQDTSDDQNLLQSARDLVQSGRISLRQCGAMPLRQAVQGPNYDGPYATPTAAEFHKAETAHEEARIEQNELNLRLSRTEVDEDADAELRKAEQRVKQAQSLVLDLHDRANYAESLHAKAQAFQHELHRAEESRKEFEQSTPYTSEPCGLPCAVFRPCDDAAEGVDDSRRSELRIPDILRLIGQQPVFVDIENRRSCLDCSFSQSRKGKKQTLCNDCTLKRRNLTVQCSNCSRPAEPTKDGSQKRMCERCDFACFRCSMPAHVSRESTRVSCAVCGNEWNVGVLGYDLLDADRRHKRVKKRLSDDSDDGDELGQGEIGHYASLWQ